jgi:ATP-dependent protease ClpP protease subunit
MDSVDAAMKEIAVLHANLPSGEPIYLSLFTPGGSILAGNLLINFLQSLDREIHTISVFAASMGFVIAQSLDNRYAVPGAIMMAHPGATECRGDKYQIKVCLNRLLALEKQHNKVCAERMEMDVEEFDVVEDIEEQAPSRDVVEDMIEKDTTEEY